MQEIFLDGLRKQGFNIVLLMGIIYWFNIKYEKLESKYDELNIYVRNEFKDIIERETQAYNAFLDHYNKTK